MIKIVDYKPLSLSDEEVEYYNAIVDAFGENIFQDTFEVNDDPNSPQYGWIMLVKPPLNKTMPMGVMYFLFNVQHNQRSRKLDEMMNKFNELMKQYEKRE